MSEPARWRAGDADREQVAEALRTAHAEGRLGIDEFGERLDAAYAATYVDELVPLTADLPPDNAAVEVVQPAGRSRPDPARPGRRGAWSGPHPAWPGWHAAWLPRAAAGPTSESASPTPYGRWPATHGCPGQAWLPRHWVGLLVLVAVVLSVVAVAGGGAPWPLLWIAIAFVVLRRRWRTRVGRSW